VDASLAEADGDEDDAEEGVELAGFWGGCLRRRPTCFGFCLLSLGVLVVGDQNGCRCHDDILPDSTHRACVIARNIHGGMHILYWWTAS
jgi:hypothetical protein